MVLVRIWQVQLIWIVVGRDAAGRECFTSGRRLVGTQTKLVLPETDLLDLLRVPVVTKSFFLRALATACSILYSPRLFSCACWVFIRNTRGLHV